MKKLILFFITLSLISFTFAASILTPPSNKASEIFVPVGKDKQISLLDLSVINVKDFQLLTGKHLNFFERMSFKISQKKLRNTISSDGTVNNQKLFTVATAADGSGFNIGGFALGFFLSLIGVLIAYLIKSENKQNLTKWAWIGFGVALVLSILFIL